MNVIKAFKVEVHAQSNTRLYDSTLHQGQRYWVGSLDTPYRGVLINEALTQQTNDRWQVSPTEFVLEEATALISETAPKVAIGPKAIEIEVTEANYTVRDIDLS